MTSTTYLGLLLVGIQVLGFVVAIHAVFTVRTTQGAIAWATSLVFMSYLTPLSYLVLGRNHFDAYIETRCQVSRKTHLAAAELDWCPWVEKAPAVCQASGYKGFKVLVRMTRTPTLANNWAHLLVNGEVSFEAMFKAISAARQVILVQFFIVRDDTLGQRPQRLLLKRAADGVEVFLLYDATDSHALPYRYAERLRQGGMQVYGLSTDSGMLDHFQVNFHNHRKVVVVDDERGFVGGHNVGVEYLGEKPPLAPRRDTHMELRGPAVACLRESFAEDWYWTTHSLLPLILPPQYDSEGAFCQVVVSGPADVQETCSLLSIEMINATYEWAWITSPYFVPNEAVMVALRLAVLCGVDVRLLIPSRPDHRTVYAASSLYALEVIRTGVKVFRYQSGFLHQKVMLVDRDTAAVGSASLGDRLFRLNFEVMVVIVDEGFAGEVETMLEMDFAESLESTPEDRRSVRRLQQLGMRAARLISPILRKPPRILYVGRTVLETVLENSVAARGPRFPGRFCSVPPARQIVGRF